LSARTKKQIDSLPKHAQHIYKKIHDNAIKQYQDPEMRRGGNSNNRELKPVIQNTYLPFYLSTALTIV
jgi:cation transport regulator ChaB